MAAVSEAYGSSPSAAAGSSEGQQEGSCLLELLPLSCWSALVDLLAARDLLCLSLSSKAVQQLLSSTPGIWCQAACNCLLASAVAGPNSSNTAAGSAASLASSASIQSSNHWHQRQQQQVAQAAAAAAWGGSSTADAEAHHMLSAFTALAFSCQRLKPQMKPQCYLLPPWLAAQPGKARGFVRLEGQTLNSALVLSEAQVHWLSLGCLSDHDGGVFTSSCSSSPRSRTLCGFMAAVVIGKALVAELYLPGGCKAPGRWAGISSPAAAAAAAAAGRSAAVAVEAELWLSTAVSLQQPATVAGDAARGSDSSRGRQRRPAQSARAVTWHDVHALLMRCIADNAARARAVQGTAVVPPGTAAAADVEARLAQLVAAGAPVLDIRRLVQCAADPMHRQHQQQQQQQQQQGPAAPWQQPAAAVGMQQANSAAAAGGVQVPREQAGNIRHTQAQAASGSRVAGSTFASPSSGTSIAASPGAGASALAGVSAGGSFAAGSSSSVASGRSRRRSKHRKQAGHTSPAHNPVVFGAAGDPSQQALQPGALAASQQLAGARDQWAAAAAAAAGALQHALAQQSSTTSSSSCRQELSLDDDALAEAVAALVQQLAKVVPQVQLLVLPVVLPGGRVGQRLPGGKAGGGSRLSAPRLLSLNVPFLVPMRHAWEQLHCLRQVLLMVGPPAPLPAVQQQQQQGLVGLGIPCDGTGDWGIERCAAGVALCDATAQLPSMLQHPLTQQQHQQQQQEMSAGGGMVRGVFSLQQLEQQWQQQVQLSSSSPGCQGDQEDWLDQELQSHNRHHHPQQQQQPSQNECVQGTSAPGAVARAGCLWASQVPEGVQHAGNADAAAAGLIAQPPAQQQQLPVYALEAVQGMVLSCMDRQALQTPTEAQP